MLIWYKNMENNYQSQAQPVARKSNTVASPSGGATTGVPVFGQDQASKGPLSNLA